jgi:hypothetical protein
MLDEHNPALGVEGVDHRDDIVRVVAQGDPGAVGVHGLQPGG